MNRGRKDSSDQVGGDLSGGEMRGLGVIAMGLLLPCGGGVDAPYPAKQLLSPYTLSYDQLSFPDLNIHPPRRGCEVGIGE